MYTADTTLNISHRMMGGRNDNSPDLQRRKRPLSIIEENLDEEIGPGSADGTITEKGFNETEQKSAKHTATLNDKDSPQTTSTKKTRKKAIIQQHHPVLTVPQHNINGSTDTVCRAERHDSVPESASTPHAQTATGGTEGDLTRLKDTATKLNLKTRRQSYLTWRAKYVDKPPDPPEVKVISDGDDKLTKERKERMDNALQWIKGQLIDLRRQDQSLARQLLGIRHELSSLKLAASCEEHQDLLDDAQDQMEELKELSRFVDFPPEMLSSSPLRQIGVTKMNLSSRRFSTC